MIDRTFIEAIVYGAAIGFAALGSFGAVLAILSLFE